jgi:hypothetical protein
MQYLFNLCFGTYFIYMIINKCVKYFSRSDCDGIPYLHKISSSFNSYINFINIVISCALCHIANLHIDKRILTEFLILFAIINMFYNILYYILNSRISAFNNINPEHKKMYVVKNFMKSITLACICFIIPFVVDDLIKGTYDLYLIKRCAIYYVINDIMGLLMVKKLPTTTVIHHTTTTLCALGTQFKNTSELDIILLIIIYAIFSSMAFCVNFYLGYQVFSKNVKRKKILSLISLIIYFTTCMINWSIQLYLGSQLFNVSVTQFSLYIVFFTSVSRDDIILMKWLYNDFKKFSAMNTLTE